MREFRIINADVLDGLRSLPDASVHCCVTSPPYWGLRDYGTAKWEGGDPECDHARFLGGNGAASEKQVTSAGTQKYQYRGICGKCGATRQDAQIGLEPTPEAYVARMVEVFREVRRVLRDDGTLWLNLGDSYTSGGRKERDPGQSKIHPAFEGDNFADGLRPGTPDGLKPKDLVGIPWRVAFALQADGWYLRSDIIWAKPNPMPESVTDRPTKAHEYLFLLTKSERYYYDAGAIAETAISAREDRGCGVKYSTSVTVPGTAMQHLTRMGATGETRNRRTVWTIATHSFPEAHFATFPPALIEPCILAGCPGPGKQCDCDEPIYTPLAEGPIDDPTMTTGRAGLNRPRRDGEGTRPITRREQREYARQMRESAHRGEMAEACGPAFDHYIRTDRSGARPLPPDLLNAWLGNGWLVDPGPCACPLSDSGTVLDPFCGSGTTGMVALRYDRNFIGCELNPVYAEMARRRISDDAPLLNMEKAS